MKLFFVISLTAMFSFCCRCAETSDVDPLEKATSLLEGTRGNCKLQELGPSIHDSRLFISSKYILDVDLFDYLATTPSTAAIARLSHHLELGAVAFVNHPRPQMEQRALTKLFLNFELIAERLIQMNAPREEIKLVAFSRNSCRDAIRSSRNFFLYRRAWELGGMTVCRAVREYAEASGDAEILQAFPADLLIPEFLDNESIFLVPYLETSSRYDHLLIYLRLEDMLKDAVGKEEHVSQSAINWFLLLCRDFHIFPLAYQLRIFDKIAYSSDSSTFLLGLLDAMIPESTVIEYYASRDIEEVEACVTKLPTLRLKYLSILGCLKRRLANCAINPLLRISLEALLNFPAYSQRLCHIRRYVLSVEDERMLPLLLKLLNASQALTNNLVRNRSIVKSFREELGVFLSLPVIQQYLFKYIEGVEAELFLTLFSINPLKDSITDYGLMYIKEHMQLEEKPEDYVDPSSILITQIKEGRMENRLDMVYLEKVAKIHFVGHLKFNGLKHLGEENQLSPITPLFLVSGHQEKLSLLQDTLPANPTYKKQLSRRLSFILMCFSDSIMATITSLHVADPPVEKVKAENFLNGMDLFAKLISCPHYKSLKAQRHVLKLLSDLKEDEDVKVFVQRAFMIHLERSGVTPYLVLTEDPAPTPMPLSNKPEKKIGYNIYELFPLLRQQFNQPCKDNESKIIALLHSVFCSKSSRFSWKLFQPVFNSLQELALDVAISTFSPENFCILVDTLNVSIGNVTVSARRLPLERRRLLLAYPWFSDNFMLLLTQKSSLNVVDIRHPEFMDHFSVPYCEISCAHLSAVPTVKYSAKSKLLGVPHEDAYWYGKLVEKFMLFLTKGEEDFSHLEGVEFLTMRLCTAFFALKNGLYIELMPEDIFQECAEAMAYMHVSRKLILYDNDPIHLKPDQKLIQQRLQSSSWISLNDPASSKILAEKSDRMSKKMKKAMDRRLKKKGMKNTEVIVLDPKDLNVDSIMMKVKELEMKKFAELLSPDINAKPLPQRLLNPKLLNEKPERVGTVEHEVCEMMGTKHPLKQPKQKRITQLTRKYVEEPLGHHDDTPELELDPSMRLPYHSMRAISKLSNKIFSEEIPYWDERPEDEESSEHNSPIEKSPLSEKEFFIQKYYFAPSILPLNKKAKMFVVDKEHIELLPDLLKALDYAEMISIDFEMTGVEPRIRTNELSTIRGVQDNKVFQMGVCMSFIKNGVEYVSVWRIDACENGLLTRDMFIPKTLTFFENELGKDFLETLSPRLLDSKVVLKEIICKIQGRRVPVITHNGYADLLHVVKLLDRQVFYLTFNLFQDHLLPFPVIYDSKHIAEIINNATNGSLGFSTALPDLFGHFFPDQVLRNHDASKDAYATMAVYRKLMHLFRELRERGDLLEEPKQLVNKIFRMHFFD